MLAKAICPKHEQAYPKDDGCPYCEVPSKKSFWEPGKGEVIIRYLTEGQIRAKQEALRYYSRRPSFIAPYICPKCTKATLEKSSGCLICESCGYSRDDI